MKTESLKEHVLAVKAGTRRFENVFQAVTRMILETGFTKTTVKGEEMPDFSLFRQKDKRENDKHIIGMYEEIVSLVSYVKDAAEGGSSREMAFVLVGEPGNGKTFFVNYLCRQYRNFVRQSPNRRYTFRFEGLDGLGTYGHIKKIASQTYEDPMILALNLFDGEEETRAYLVDNFGMDDQDLQKSYANYRPLGACTAYIWEDLRAYYDGDMAEMLKAVKIIPVPLSESLGTLTGKYPAKDKITSSAVDLLGEESIQRLLHISDTDNPYRFDLRRGALARVAGGGIHFVDEIYKNKKDLVQIYLGVIQNRTIEMEGFKWPIDTLIVATSNNDEFNRFKSEREEAPIIDRCCVCYVAHNTDYKLQKTLTQYAIGNEQRTTFGQEKMHEDPNLNIAASIAVVLTRLPYSDKLTPLEMLNLAAGEIAGEKSLKTLVEVIDTLDQDPDISKRFGQKGLGQRNLGRALQVLTKSPEANEGQCMFAYDVFRALQRIILDYVADANDRTKFLADLEIAKGRYRDAVQKDMFNAYMNEPDAITRDVMSYVNMVIGINADNLGPDKMWKYRDPQTRELKALKIDERFLKSVEERLSLKTEEQRRNFRTTIRKIYSQKLTVDPNYDFMDNQELVKAVTDVRLKSDIAGAGSLVGALANRTNEENQKLYNRMIDAMLNQLGYCRTCAQKTIEYFCTQDDEK